MEGSAKTTQELYDEYSDVFTEIGYFKGTFSLQFKEGTTSHQAPISTWHTHYRDHLRKK